MNILTITGWGQKLDSLDQFASKFGKVKNLPYVNYKDFDEVVVRAKKFAKETDIIIGWSLGAQIAVRLVERKVLKPRLLVLLAPPFQYVSSNEISSGINHFLFYAFQQAYSAFPSNTLRKFGVLVCQNDDHAMSIIETMDDDMTHHNGWIKWLEELGNFSCTNLNYSKFPKTLIFHGDGDAVTNLEQGKMFKKHIHGSKLYVIKKCGHAPHLHDPDFIGNKIKEALKK